MDMQTLLISAALVLAAPAAQASYVVSFAGATPGPTTQLWVSDSVVAHGSLYLNFSGGNWQATSQVPPWMLQGYLRPWNSSADGSGHQMDTGVLAIAFNPDGTVAGGRVANADGSYTLAMQGQGNTWAGTVNGQPFSGQWVASYSTTIPANVLDEYPGQTYYNCPPLPLGGGQPAQVPEPGALGLLAGGLGLLGFARKFSVG